MSPFRRGCGSSNAIDGDIINERQGTKTDGAIGSSQEGQIERRGGWASDGGMLSAGKRIWHRYKKAGGLGLVHRSRGKPGARRKEAKFLSKVLARYQQRYPISGPRWRLSICTKKAWK